MRLKRISISFLCFIIIFLVMNVFALSESNKGDAGQQKNQQTQPVSYSKLMGISAVSVFSPGIALLSLAYNVKKEHNAEGENNWLVGWIWLFWIVAFIDVTLDKIPLYAHIHHFMQHGLIWFVAYAAVTALGVDVTMFLGALTGSTVQAVRQGYHGAVAIGSAATGTPVVSTIEDIVTGVAMFHIL